MNYMSVDEMVMTGTSDLIIHCCDLQNRLKAARSALVSLRNALDPEDLIGEVTMHQFIDDVIDAMNGEN